MTYEMISSDGIGVRALLAAAEKVRELTDERNIILGVLKGQAIRQDEDVAVVVAKADAGTPGAILVSIERNPRIFRQAPAEPEPVAHRVRHAARTEHEVAEGEHLGSQGDCWCTADCCNNTAGDCTCSECQSEHHDH